MTSTIDARKDARANGTYDVYIDIDCDCQELLDAIGLDYTTSEDDESQNEVKLILDEEDWDNFKFNCNFNYTDEQDLGSAILNRELGEYVTKVTIFKPDGNIISFY